MKRLLLILAGAVAVTAADPAIPETHKPAPAARPPTIAAAPKAVKRHSLVHFLRRIGKAEVDMAIRLSGWGIPDPGTAEGRQALAAPISAPGESAPAGESTVAPGARRAGSAP